MSIRSLRHCFDRASLPPNDPSCLAPVPAHPGSLTCSFSLASRQNHHFPGQTVQRLVCNPFAPRFPAFSNSHRAARRSIRERVNVCIVLAMQYRYQRGWRRENMVVGRGSRCHGQRGRPHVKNERETVRTRQSDIGADRFVHV